MMDWLIIYLFFCLFIHSSPPVFSPPPSPPPLPRVTRLDMKSIEGLERVLEEELPKVLLEFGNPFERQS